MKTKMTTIDDVIEFIIKNSDNTQRMDRINKITFPFTSKYDSKFTKKKASDEIRIGGSWYQPSYWDFKDFIERDDFNSK